MHVPTPGEMTDLATQSSAYAELLKLSIECIQDQRWSVITTFYDPSVIVAVMRTLRAQGWIVRHQSRIEEIDPRICISFPEM